MGKTLIISEKPNAAKKIASALSEDGFEESKLYDAPYYELERNGKDIVVVSALGHLFTLKNKEPMRDYPVYDIEWVPSYEVYKSAERSEPFVKAIDELAEDADEFINAADYDVEGAVIGYTALKHLCGEDALDKAKRMKFSTLTAGELEEAYENLLPELDEGLVDSGLARHELDWYWGMNLSKALSSAVEAAHDRFVKLSVGRVQTPTLKILLEREKEIEAFEPEPYWVIKLLFELNDQEVEAQHETKKFFDGDRAREVRDKCKGKPTEVVGVKTRKYTQKPPTPFNLSALQSEAYNCFGYTPAKTQQLAQSLYDDALISYPRTSSKKLPSSIDYIEIIKKIGKIRGYKGRVKKLLKKSELKPRQGKKKDPAHPAIYPTGEKPKDLEGPRRKIYDLIVKRFLSVFGEKAVKQSIKVNLEVEDEPFFLRGRRILEKNWLEYYEPYGTTDEIILPELEEGQKLKPEEFSFEEKETQPPARYNQSSTVKEMENRNLGTKATRAHILANIYDRNYIEGKQQIEVTEIGGELIESLEEHCPEIVSEDLTVHFEKEMESIREEERNREEILEEAKKTLSEILDEFKKHEEEIGEPLGEAYRKTRRRQKILGECDECEDGQLKIIVSRRTKKRFAGCTNYPDCTNSFPLPQNGGIVPQEEVCEECGEPVIKVLRKGKRPYTMCINHNCSTKDEWVTDPVESRDEDEEKKDEEKDKEKKDSEEESSPSKRLTPLMKKYEEETDGNARDSEGNLTDEYKKWRRNRNK